MVHTWSKSDPVVDPAQLVMAQSYRICRDDVSVNHMNTSRAGEVHMFSPPVHVRLRELCVVRYCEFGSHLAPDVPIDEALANLRCSTREVATAGSLDSEHLLKVLVVGRKKPVAQCVVSTMARPTGYQNPRTI